MKKPSRKTINLFILIVLVIIFGYVLSVVFQKPLDGVLINFFDVGQGDAALIKTPQGQTVLIDGGPDTAIISKIDQIIPFYKRRIDAVILTHPHSDHLSGLLAVVDSYEIKTFYLTGVIYGTPEYNELLTKLKENKIPVKSVVAGDRLMLSGGVELDFLFPYSSLQEKTVENINNSSIVTRLSWDKSSALFMGDLEKEAQPGLNKELLKSNLLKVSHHCSADAISRSFIGSVSPKYAVISVGKDNSFGHPSRTCLSLLKSTQVFRTDQDGDIAFLMTKKSITPIKLK